MIIITAIVSFIFGVVAAIIGLGVWLTAGIDDTDTSIASKYDDL